MAWDAASGGEGWAASTGDTRAETQEGAGPLGLCLCAWRLLWLLVEGRLGWGSSAEAVGPAGVTAAVQTGIVQ